MDAEAVVIGAGVVGLALGRALAEAGRDVFVLEADNRIGTGVSARNSEVIHAGLYYPPRSLKARSCVLGRERLYRYCTEREVPHRRVGKLIVAGPGQQDTLRRLKANAKASGAGVLEWLDEKALDRRAPAVRGAAALWSPRTGIVDSHTLMARLAEDIEAAGGWVVRSAPVLRLLPEGRGLRLDIGGPSPHRMLARRVIVAAGLASEALVRPLLLDALPARAGRPLAKGNYFRLRGHSPFEHLVYPLPEPGGLGIHATLDLAGQTRFGPDVEWVQTPSYEVDPARAPRFYEAIRRYWPGLPDGALHPDYAGVRPKLTGPDEPAADFRILGPDQHGQDGLTVMLGIESPGLTAALGLAELFFSGPRLG